MAARSALAQGSIGLGAADRFLNAQNFKSSVWSYYAYERVNSSSRDENMHLAMPIRLAMMGILLFTCSLEGTFETSYGVDQDANDAIGQQQLTSSSLGPSQRRRRGRRRRRRQSLPRHRSGILYGVLTSLCVDIRSLVATLRTPTCEPRNSDQYRVQHLQTRDLEWPDSHGERVLCRASWKAHHRAYGCHSARRL